MLTGRQAEDVFVTEPGPWQAHDPAVLAAEVRALVPRDVPPDTLPGTRECVLAAAEAGIPVAIVTSARPTGSRSRSARVSACSTGSIW